MENKSMFPTEEVTLPSKGLIYPPENPLSKGVVEMKYMTAEEEDILTNESYIKKGTVIDKLLQSLIVTPINYDDLIIGDKNALLVASRVLGYGKDYTFKVKNKQGEDEEHTIDLTELEDKELQEEYLLEIGKNEFEFTLPTTKKVITFKLLNTRDERKIEAEVKSLKKTTKVESLLTTRLKHMILSVDGDYETKTIRNFVDNQFLSKDTRVFREHLTKVQPDVNMKITLEMEDGDVMEDIQLPIGITFLWPDARI